MARRLAQIVAEFDLRGCAYDRWAINDLKVILDSEGIQLPLVEWGQGYRDMAPAVDAFEAALLAGELRHGNHPILRWHASNAVFDVDPAGARSEARRVGTECVSSGKSRW